jgi:hypothetical protein
MNRDFKRVNVNRNSKQQLIDINSSFYLLDLKKLFTFSRIFNSDYDSKLDAIEKKIEELENSEQYKALANVCVRRQASEEDRCAWELLK